MKPATYLSSHLLDIIFEHKNKNYGAYQLRMTYPQRLKKSLVVMTSLVAALSLFFVINLLRAHTPPPPLLQNAIELSEVKIKEFKPPEIVIPRPPAAPKMAAQIKYTQPDVVKDQLVRPQEQPPDLDQIKANTISIQTKEGSFTGLQVALIAESRTGVTQNEVTDKPFIHVEQMPHFRGTTTDEESNRKALEFVSRHIHYPDVAREQNIAGMVVIQFIIAADGKLENIHVVGKKPGGGLAQEAIRVIGEMPNWTPGRQNGRNVAVQYTLPIRFSLK